MKRAWGNATGALFFVIVFGAAAILLTVHGVWPLARTLFGAGALVALGGGAWGSPGFRGPTARGAPCRGAA